MLLQAGILLIAVLQAGPAATVQGRILDTASGAPIAGAAVELPDAGRRTFSDPAGHYSFPAVPPGPQHLTVDRLGFVSRTVHLLVPSSGGLEMNVSIESRPIGLRSLMVSVERPVRGVEHADTTAFPDRGLSAAALRDHPTLAQPDPFRSLSGGEVVMDPEAAAGVHIRGGGADHTAYVLDGVPVLNPYHAAGLFSAWNPDALGGIRLLAAAPSPELPDALSGVIAAHTRAPGARFHMATSLSTAEARVTVDGPAGPAGYLLSWRAGLAGSVLAKGESSYVTGDTRDLLAKVQLPVGRGILRLLGYRADNELAAASAVIDDFAAVTRRNRFAWESRSTGVQWARSWSWVAVRAAGWQAVTESGSTWVTTPGATVLSSMRRDDGLELVLSRASGVTASELGVRVHTMTTDYRVDAPETGWRARGSRRIASAFAQHARTFGDVAARASASVSLLDGRVHAAPRAELRWQATPTLEWSLAFGRTHQFSQSLRNPESPVSHIFPADLFLGAGTGGVPVPTSDQVVVAGGWRPRAGLRIAAQVFGRRMHSVLIGAHRSDGPFATTVPATGDVTVRGAAVDVAAQGARYGFVASYGWQRVRYGAGRTDFTPRHGTSHLVESGVIAFPSPTASVRLAIAAGIGRRAAAIGSGLEWEACNALDQGCEFAGSPLIAGETGADRLPAYVRLDVGGRKHWHVGAGGRDLLIGMFGTVTNLLGRGNVLLYAVDADTGERRPVHMISRSLLVVGIDARF